MPVIDIATPEAESEAEFDALVTKYYKIWREELRPDIAFLVKAKQSLDVDAFDHSIYMLRTAVQHSDNPEAVKFRDRWCDSFPGWPARAAALGEKMERALASLATRSTEVRRNRDLTRAWAEVAAADPLTVFRGVCQDLGASFPDGVERFMVGSVERRVLGIRPGSDVRAAVEAFCEEQILGRMKRLPVPYYEVLDRLSLLRHSDARAALLLAHTVAATTRLGGDEFIDKVEQAWKLVKSA